MKYKIEIECPDWYLADTLFDLSCMIENDDLLDQMQDGRVETSGNHFKATITDTEVKNP